MQDIGTLDWHKIYHALDSRGWAIVPGILIKEECRRLQKHFTECRFFRNHIVMSRHGYGEGEYKYFSYPLPQLIANLRREIYEKLVPVANRWSHNLANQPFPEKHADFIRACHRAGQTRPTPLLLKYKTGDYNRLHQDLYGEIYFPIQAAILLSNPGHDFDGGEFVLTEQKPRSQTRVAIAPLDQGDAVIFAVNERPALGNRGYYRLKMRHGICDVRRGERFTLGVIFHDAK